MFLTKALSLVTAVKDCSASYVSSDINNMCAGIKGICFLAELGEKIDNTNFLALS